MEKEKKLEDIIRSYKSVLVSYSGGVDSSLLLYMSQLYLGKSSVVAFIADSETYPTREKDFAISFCKKLGIDFYVVNTNELADENFYKNPVDRCYYCKLHLFKCAYELKEKLGFEAIFEGSNHDDLKDFRPGRRALEELGVKSPLLMAGLTKNEIREISKKYNLSTYNKPSKACLASRIYYGQSITKELLERIDKAEVFLEDLGFSIVRVRVHNEIARIEVDEENFRKIIDMKDDIIAYFLKLGFKFITLDLEGFRSGSMNRIIGGDLYGRA